MTDSTNTILAARTLLGSLTPLRTDCGRLCGGACCQGDEKTGMLLFPGEEPLLKNCGFGTTIPAEYEIGGISAKLFVCQGHCIREARPLACRLFPLLPRFKKDGSLTIKPDPRAASCCPLLDYGIDGLDTRFVEATEEACRLMLSCPELGQWMRALDRELTL